MAWKYLIPLLGVSILDLSFFQIQPLKYTVKVKSAYLRVGRGADWGLPADMAGYLHRVWYTPHNALLAARVGQLPFTRPKTQDVMDLVVDLLVQVLRWLV